MAARACAGRQRRRSDARLVAHAPLRGARGHVCAAGVAHDDRGAARGGGARGVGAARGPRRSDVCTHPGVAWAGGPGSCSGCCSGASAGTSRATGSSTSPAPGSCSSSTTSRSTGSRSSRTEASIPATPSRSGTASSRSIAKVAGVDPEQVVVHLPSVLAALAVVVAYEAGWALFRRTWAAGAAAGGAGRDDLLRAGPRRRVHGSRRCRRPRPVSCSCPPLSLSRSRPCGGRRPALYATDRGCGARARGRAPDVRDLPLAAVRRLPASCERCGRGPTSGRVWRRSPRSSVPAALFMLWLIPVVNDTASVSPDAKEVRRALEHYAGQLDVHSETSYSLRARGVHAERSGCGGGDPPLPAGRASPRGAGGPPTSPGGRSRFSR